MEVIGTIAGSADLPVAGAEAPAKLGTASSRCPLALHTCRTVRYNVGTAIRLMRTGFRAT